MDQITLNSIQIATQPAAQENAVSSYSVDAALLLYEDAKEYNAFKLGQDAQAQIVSYCEHAQLDAPEAPLHILAGRLLNQFPVLREATLTLHAQSVASDIAVSVTRGWVICYLAIGSNLGDRLANLSIVWQEIENDAAIVGLAKSEYIETPPYGVLDQPDFLNGAIKLRTYLTPRELLAFCKHAERLANRIKTRYWGERTLDVDILLYGDRRIFTDDLKIPHPEMHIRDFVLEPLCQIEPFLIHPVKNMSMKELLAIIKQ